MILFNLFNQVSSFSQFYQLFFCRILFQVVHNFFISHCIIPRIEKQVHKQKCYKCCTDNQKSRLDKFFHNFPPKKILSPKVCNFGNFLCKLHILSVILNIFFKIILSILNYFPIFLPKQNINRVQMFEFFLQFHFVCLKYNQNLHSKNLVSYTFL